MNNSCSKGAAKRSRLSLPSAVRLPSARTNGRRPRQGTEPGKKAGQQGDPARSLQLGVQARDAQRQQQAPSLAYFDVFWPGAVQAALVLLVLLMNRWVAEKAEHTGEE
jgi:hypothetical protein